MRVSPATLLIVLPFSLCSCDHRTDPMAAVREPPSVQAYVTGDALQHLDASGHFVLEPARAPDDVPIISPARVSQLATAFLHTWGESHSAVWQYERGGEPLSVGSLHLSPRMYFAQTPHGRFPDGYHGAVRRMYGPQYLVFFDQGAEPELGVAISAYASDLTIENGNVREPREGGSYFTTHAVARSGRSPYVPVSPEEAVAIVSERTGAKVTQVPDLILRAGWHPLLAMWRLRLDRAVTVTRRGGGNGAGNAVREVFVSANRKLFVAAADQPAAIRVPAPRSGQPAGAPEEVIDLPRRPDMPLRFDEIDIPAESKQ